MAVSGPNPLHLIRRGCVTLVSEQALKEKLESGRQLIIKAGFDPTAPDLHLGHTVLLRKLRHFQDLQHKVIFLIGDATGLVGDPSGRTHTRPALSWDEVRANSQTYHGQVRGILRTDPKVFEIRYNSEWFLGHSPAHRQHEPESFNFSHWVHLASKYTVARLIERDDFSKRLKAGKPLSVLELFYPLMQGYDSVKLAEQYGRCDVELGGTDQTFNLLLGRELLKEYGHEPQVVLTMPLLEGLDGIQKMSKSLGNHVGIQEPPSEMFGKLMSIPDTLIVKYFTLLTDVEAPRLKELEQQLATKRINPRDAKAELAREIVGTYHSPKAAQEAQAQFTKVFSHRQPPSQMPVVQVHVDSKGQVNVVELLVAQKLAKTKNDARRLVRQGGVKLNGTVVKTPMVTLEQVDGATLQVGTRHFRRLKKT